MKKKTFLCAVVIFCLLTNAFADWPSEIKIEASDGHYDNYFGGAVSVDKQVCAIGAYSDNIHRGAVYIYRFDGTDWIEEQKLTASDEFLENYFGYSVCIQGDICVVGTMGRADNGSVYVFRYNGVSWIEEQKLPLPAEASSFGSSVAIVKNSFGNIDYCIVGDSGVRVDEMPRGAAFTYWYNNSSGSWQFGQKLIPADYENGNLFGSAISISGDYCVIGMPGDDVNAVDSGSAYIFKNGPTGWVQQQKVTPTGIRDDWERFGESVSIDANMCIIGASGVRQISEIEGAAYAYFFNGINWIEGQKLTALDGEFDNEFGSSVSVFGDICVIGASDADNGVGSAYVFKFTSWWITGWDEIIKLRASDGPHQYRFGASVAMNGNSIIVGQQAFIGGIGSAYVYDLKCPVGDLTGDCYVNVEDFAIMASQWLDGIEPLDIIP